MFVPDASSRFPTLVRPDLACPRCGQRPFEPGLVTAPPPQTVYTPQAVGASPLGPRPENKQVYMPAHCTTYGAGFLIDGYEVNVVPDSGLGLTDPACTYFEPPFFHVLGSLRCDLAKPGVAVKRFMSFNIGRYEPDCPLCGRRTTFCGSCGRWFCALEYCANPLRSLRYVVKACPHCGNRLCSGL